MRRAPTAVLALVVAVLGGLLVGCSGGPTAGLDADPHGMSLRIQKIGVQSSLVPSGLAADRTLQLPPTAEQAGWYDQGPLPGDDGPAVIVGHLAAEGREGVFARLADLHEGDQILVRRDGRDLPFTVTRTTSTSKNRFPTADVYSDTAYPELRLITDGGDLDRTAHTYKSNLIVFAALDT